MAGGRLGQTQLFLSGEGLRQRVDSAENRAVNYAPKKKKPKDKPVSMPHIPQQQKLVDERKRRIAEQQAADRAAIAAMQAKKGLRRN